MYEYHHQLQSTAWKEEVEEGGAPHPGEGEG